MNDDEVSLVVDYFAALDGYKLGPVVVEAREEAHSPKVHRGDVPSELFDCSACHVMGGGRVPRDLYSISREVLTTTAAAEWIEEHLGVEVAGAQAQADAVEALREFLEESEN